jgi:Cd2+/Zn2+-exporting ATPase/Cu+-exporting ATPase
MASSNLFDSFHTKKIAHDHSHARKSTPDKEHEHAAGVVEYVRLGLLALIIIASLTGWWKNFMSRDWLAFAATVIGGWPILKEAWENLRKRRMTMELSMTLALVAALSIGQFFTALVIAFFVLFAELLEGYTVGGGRRAIQTLIESLPRRVTARRDGQERELSTSEIGRGETIIIRPGERIPTDGEVIKGHSFVDQASITGESLPVEKIVGSKVFAGTISKDGVLELKVERIGRDTTFGKIIDIGIRGGSGSGRPSALAQRRHDSIFRSHPCSLAPLLPLRRCYRLAGFREAMEEHHATRVRKNFCACSKRNCQQKARVGDSPAT